MPSSPTHSARAAAPDPRAEARRCTELLISGLRRGLAEAGMRQQAASRALGHAPNYLSKVFAGRVRLKMDSVFGLLRLLGREPLYFFGRLFSLSPHAASQALSSGLDLYAELARLTALADTQLADRPASGWVLLCRQSLRLAFSEDGVKMRAASRALGLKPDSLGNALRGRSALSAGLVFGSLALLGRSPAAFFAEVCNPGEEPAGLPWRDLVGLAERASRTHSSQGRTSAPALRAGGTPRGTPGGGRSSRRRGAS